MPLGSYVVIDLETTGLDPQLEGILEIAAVRLEGGTETAMFQRLVNPGVEISEASQAVHGISEDMVALAPPVAAVLDEFLDFIGATPLVAHNAAFDVNFLNRALVAAGKPVLANQALDTLEMAREVFPEQRSYRLEAICRLLGDDSEGFHRALDDARHLARVLPRLLELYRQKQAWYRAQFERIDYVARRYDLVSRLLEDLQAEQADMRRLLGHYFEEHPEARIALPGGDSLISATKQLWEYDLATLLPQLSAWGLGEKFLKLDRPRLERWLTGHRLTPEQKERIAASRVLAGRTTRLTKVSQSTLAEDRP